ncbi:MAG: glycosyltransferase family 2 protein [Oscillospiraceae bacterium]|nr:glycosyltransferase family 2 protein [Oscillospiraceae bacterium]
MHTARDIKRIFEMSNIQDSPLKFVKRNLNIKRITSLASRGVASLKNEGFEATWRKIDFRIKLMTKGDVWKFRSDIPLKRELKAQREAVFPYMPKISIIVPLYNTPEKFLKEMIDSVYNQSYSNWQLVLADASDKDLPHIKKVVDSYGDSRIVYEKLAENKGISENTNKGFALADGDYLALLDHDDVILPNALYENVKAINETGAQVLYSDEITLDGELKHLIQFHFKIDYAPDFLRGVNYITHFLVFERKLFEQVGAYEDATYDGAQDFDLTLRLSEKANKVHHIPKVLYYWRGHAGSTANDMSTKMYAFEAGRKAIQAHLDRIGLKGQVSIQKYPGSYRTVYEVDGNPQVSIVIPNKDHIEDLSRCIDSIFALGGWDNVQVIVVENNSTEKETFAYYEKITARNSKVQVVYYKGGFNFSAICNFGVQFATGDHILLLNNDVEFISENFVKEMLSYSQRSDVGAVGAKLYYPDGYLQHAGVIIGINGSAGHSHKGLADARNNTGDMYRLVTTQNYLAVTGACLMVKTELYKKFPLDEENFAVAYNDVDFCLRLYEAGYLNVFTPYSEGIHYESKSRGLDETDKPNLRYEGEKARFAEKWQKYFNYGDPYYNPHFTLLYENYGYK